MIHKDKYIFCKKELLSQEECKLIIDDFELKEKFKGPTTSYFGEFKGQPTVPFQEYGEWFYESEGIDINKQFWIEYLFDSLEEYKIEHPFLASENMAAWRTNTIANIQKYIPNKYYKKEHCEDDSTNNRMLAWMIYLNTVNEGGGTVWPQQNVTTKAIAGDLYIWPAAWTHSHRGIVAPKEEKYIITGWSSFVV